MQNNIFVVDVITRPSTCLKASRVQIMLIWFSRTGQEDKTWLSRWYEVGKISYMSLTLLVKLNVEKVSRNAKLYFYR